MFDQERDTRKVLNTFFSDIDDNINIADYSSCDPRSLFSQKAAS